MELLKLCQFASNTNFKGQLATIKLQNKQGLATYIQDKYGIEITVHSIFDIQIKRIHAYKRQILNALHIMHLYNVIKENPSFDIVPRTFIFSWQSCTKLSYCQTNGQIN